MVVLTDTEWDMQGLKDPEKKEIKSDNAIVMNAKQTYKKIYTASLTLNESDEKKQAKPEFLLNRLGTRNLIQLRKGILLLPMYNLHIIFKNKSPLTWKR